MRIAFALTNNIFKQKFCWLVIFTQTLYVSIALNMMDFVYNETKNK